MDASTESRRRAILAAAERVFAERGYGDTPLRDLIARSGHSTTVFYARFKGKDAVLEALVEELLERVVAAAWGAVSESTSLDDGSSLGIAALVAVLEPHRGLVAVTLTEGLAVPAVRAQLARANAALASALTTGLRAQGHPDAEAGGWALVGALTLQVQRWAVFEEVDTAGLPEVLIRASSALRRP